ncbi:DUF2306 domain-containing protein [Schlegelella sp. S2-27]|uniref:DUF2306 domain-containing protein n=1 Tax=Caldimonas mangrovi TaxID=2944811 RepID=A0ABT0YJ34_9BURK|nr:DUF2306 domain-containing protein [Caldimonas mangrovi]MCM5678166.1 DUF2306 domain-containing protein [Caldimonas mangrovi]
MTLDTLHPAIVVHLFLAMAALLLGPVALTVPKGSRWHRAAGYGWVTLMFGTALSSLFIRNFERTNVGGYTPIHMLVLLVALGIGYALWNVARGNIKRHRRLMWMVYLGACVVAGGFTLMPHRTLGQLVWHHTLGIV